ncbi:hypothetical protein [Methanococcus maripaludis]|uniref:Uncharacterized protein n=1 Tax=Methanococcus maripaludis TaxID=39152 RepID=A0A7J9S596_METMI|nr:hypothetical protein [Methanococcus maripaludis]MBB6067852.1 hypothetical protein [Methanococcus maripaludis]
MKRVKKIKVLNAKGVEESYSIILDTESKMVSFEPKVYAMHPKLREILQAANDFAVEVMGKEKDSGIDFES